MHKVEIRPGVSMAYEDHWFGPPWTAPETVVMVHGNSEILARLDLLGAASRRQLPRGAARPAGLRRIAGAARLRLERERACRRYRTLPRCAGDRALPSDRRQIRRLGLHAVRAATSRIACGRSACSDRRCAAAAPAMPTLIRAKGVRQWAADTMRARLGSAASEAQIRWWTDELMGKTNRARRASAPPRRASTWSSRPSLSRITAPTLIVTTQESGLQSVAAVERYARRFPDARVIVLPGDSYHIAAVEPDLCAQHALAFIEQVSRRNAREGRGVTGRHDRAAHPPGLGQRASRLRRARGRRALAPTAGLSQPAGAHPGAVRARRRRRHRLAPARSRICSSRSASRSSSRTAPAPPAASAPAWWRRRSPTATRC